MYLFCNGSRIMSLPRDYLMKGHPLPLTVGPFPEVHVKADTELRMFSGIVGGGFCARPAHHEAGAGDDAVFESFYDPLVDSVALTKIISVHDQVLGLHEVNIPGH